MKNLFMKQSVDERRKMILEGSILKTLVLLSLPTLLMGVVQSLIPIVDSLFLNRAASYKIAAAVGFVVPIISILNGMSMGLGVSGMAMIGNANGKGDMKKVRHISTQIMVFAFLLGCLAIPLNFIIGSVTSKYINPEIAYDVKLYLQLYSFVLPFLFLTSIFNSIKNATGQPEATLYRMIIMLVLKVIFNYIYLCVFHLGTVGSVLGSFSSFLLVSIWMYYDLFVKKSDIRLTLKGFKFDFHIIGELLRLGIPAMLNAMTVYLGFVLINLEVQRYGGDVLNAETIASNLSNVSFLIPSSLGTTLTTMVSMSVANKDIKRAKKAFFTACITAIAVSVMIVIIFIPITQPLVYLFNIDEKTIKIAKDAIFIYNLSIAGFAIYMVVQGAFVGMGRTKIPLITGILRIWLFRYIFVIFFEEQMGVYAVFWGNLFSNTLAGAVSFVMALMLEWKSTIKEEDDKKEIDHGKGGKLSLG